MMREPESPGGRRKPENGTSERPWPCSTYAVRTASSTAASRPASAAATSSRPRILMVGRFLCRWVKGAGLTEGDVREGDVREGDVRE